MGQMFGSKMVTMLEFGVCEPIHHCGPALLFDAPDQVLRRGMLPAAVSRFAHLVVPCWATLALAFAAKHLVEVVCPFAR